MKKHFFDLQLFAEDGTAATGGDDNATDNGTATDTAETGKENKPNPRTVAKYSEDDLDKIIAKKIAEDRQTQARKAEKERAEEDEARKLAEMNEQQRTKYEIDKLRKELADYKHRDARTAMGNQARAMLQEAGLNVNDDLLANLISDDADGTKSAVEGFISLFNEAVDRKVKEKVRGEIPKAGSSAGGVTKEQILAITNRAERQRMMREHSNLF
jgi:hypothetical protein